MSYRTLLTEYPVGARRRVLLAVVVLALFISAFEGQLAPVLPLLLDDLGMSLKTYGLITAASLIFGALAGYLGGELADRVGRVRILVPFMFLSAAACLFMATADSVGHFALARIVLAFVEGVAVAGTQPLIRDFTPRMGRAQAFAFWSWGSVGANFFAAAVASATLGVFGNQWRSQLFIMAGAALVGAIVVALTLRDLSPEVRRAVRLTERESHAVEVPQGAKGLRLLVARREFWTHVLAMSFLYVLLATMNAYAQTMLVQQFGVSVRAASAMTMVFWLSNLALSLVFARVSDRTQRRKAFMVGGGVAAAIFLGAFLALMGRGSEASSSLVVVLFIGIGVALAATFGPWMASFSEHVEEVHPDIQGRAFGLNHLLNRTFILATVLFAPRVVEATGGWERWMTVVWVATVLFTLTAALVPAATGRRFRTDADAEAVAQPTS
ncbi:MFS transporter, OPA family, glycerol-3-phosphate transporter [Nocardioides sp. YR527]|uniref:MFS transporter n=1 Tax=Nocardioides sp. YR527 TaxID=1881028 RepID=UPI00087F7600|nr:MFS transporter [Nocardioides sp. YR527]SDJ85304.1 MFS transporter, OPA family, glycerol-3-phosphate transporter [Nocardioides sp. YR527]